MYFLLAKTDDEWEVAVAELTSYEQAVIVRAQEEEWEAEHPEAPKFEYIIVEKSIRE